jgi:hypothetical protein
MAGQKISELTSTTPQTTDLLPIARGTSNFSVTAQSIAALGGGGTVTSVSGTGTVNGITLSGSVTDSGNLTLSGAVSGIDLTTQTTGNLPVTRLNNGTNAASTTFWRGDGTWQSISSMMSGTSLTTRPLVGMIAHSYGNNTCAQAHITTYQILDSAGTVAVSTFSNLLLSATPGSDWVRIWGLGVPFDGVYPVTSSAGNSTNTTGTLETTANSTTQILTAANSFVFPGMAITGLGVPANTQVVSVTGKTFVANKVINGAAGTVLTFTQPYVITMFNASLAGTPAQSVPTFMQPMGKAFAGAAGNSGIGAGLAPQGGIPWANAYLGHAFELLPNYIYNVSGGKIVPTAPNDPGFVNMCTNLVSNKSASLPKYVFIDHGVNDANGFADLSTVQTAVISGIGILRTYGIVPIWLVPRPFNGATAQGQWDNSFTSWLKLYLQKVGGICIDTNLLLVDPTSASNAFLTATSADGLHLSCNGGMRDGRIIAQQLYPIFRPMSGWTPSGTDRYNASYPYGNLLPSPVSNFPGGTFPGTVASSTLTAALDTPVQMSTVYVQAQAFNNTGTRNVKAQVAARTDTTADGTPIPGNELVITIEPGTGANACFIAFGNNSSGYFYPTTNGTGTGTPILNIGDQYQMDVEIYIPSSSVEDGVIYDIPRAVTRQNIQYNSGVFRQAVYGTFTNGTQYFNQVSYPGGAIATLGKDMRISGIGENGLYKPSAIISTPPMKWLGNYDGGNQSIYMIASVSFGIVSGTTSVNFVAYIRGISLRKLDPNTAYPFD